ncbi:MAG: hypothetical protein JSS90_04370 [Bacteroidetes bacterium]|nr:hypothetical protein [Bacteroidota bacterium]
MFTRKKISLLILLLTGMIAEAQNVGIGTSTPIQKLDVIGNIRSSTLTGVGNRLVMADPTGTLNVTTSGLLDSVAWLTLGNSSIDSTKNFLGTLNSRPVIFKTNGNAAANERMRIMSTGQILINRATPLTGDVFTVFGSGLVGATNSLGNYAVNGYVGQIGAGVYGENAEPTNINSHGVLGINSGLGNGVAGINSGTGAGVRGQATNASGGIGVIGFTSVQAGVQGQASTTGDGVRGYNTQTTAGAGDGIYGQAAWGGNSLNFSSSGVVGFNSSTTGIGVLGASGNGGIYALNNGQGGAFSGNKNGVCGFVGKDSTINSATPSAGGYFYCNNSAFAYVGARISGTNYKVTGTGSAGTFVKDLNDQYRIMVCPEAPEILFQDYGSGQLSNGETYITLDPILVKNILVDSQHPLRVFIQLEDDCNGVFVTQKTINGFKVKELANGSSNAKFSWSIVANRADEKDANGNIVSINANNRFVPAPGAQGMNKKTTILRDSGAEPIDGTKPKLHSND